MLSFAIEALGFGAVLAVDAKAWSDATLDELAGRTRFEDAVSLLFEGFYPDLPADIPAALGRARAEVFSEVQALDTGLLDRTPSAVGHPAREGGQEPGIGASSCHAVLPTLRLVDDRQQDLPVLDLLIGSRGVDDRGFPHVIAADCEVVRVGHAAKTTGSDVTLAASVAIHFLTGPA